MENTNRDFDTGVAEAARVKEVLGFICTQNVSIERVIRSSLNKLDDYQLANITRLIDRIVSTRERDFYEARTARADLNRQQRGTSHATV